MAEEGLIFMGIFRKENELKKLDKILNYAVSQVPYYKNKEYQSIEDFPIIKKEIIKADYSNFISDEVENKNKSFLSHTNLSFCRTINHMEYLFSVILH